MSKLQKSPSICIVGAGFSGICAALKLKLELKLETFEVFELMDEIGGTWSSSIYPGASSDAPVHLYSYSFEQRPNWKQKYGRQQEILEYLKHVSTKHGILQKINLRHEVKEIKWNEDLFKWKVLINDIESAVETEREFDIVILGTGLLRSPKIPEEFLGFKGSMFHTSRWSKNIDLTNKTVAVVGVGASGIQVIPEIAKLSKSLLVYQRRPCWILPKTEYEYSYTVQWLFKYFPCLQNIYRWTIFRDFEKFWEALKTGSPTSQKYTEAGNFFREQELGAHPDLLKKLTPQDPFGCQRTLFSADYYQTLKGPKTKLITSKISSVREDSIITSEGVEKVDVLILATGFNVTEFFSPIKIFDETGKDLLDSWKKSTRPELYLGITGQNLPNLFFLWGPNTTLGHNSIVLMIENQMDWIIKCIRWMLDENATLIRIKKSVVDEYMDQVANEMSQMIWTSAGCNPPTQYANQMGHIVSLYPGTVQSYRTRIQNFSKHSLEFK